MTKQTIADALLLLKNSNITSIDKVELLINDLVNDGYKLTVNYRIILQNFDKGISIRICGYGGSIALFARTKTGGYERYGIYFGSEIQRLMTDIMNFSSPKMDKRLTKIENLPKPYEFLEIDDIILEQGFICRNGVISKCRVANIVTINDNISLNDEVAIPKDKDAWFHLDCKNEVGATFDIISDGETWYPIKRYGIKKISNNMNPKASIDLSKMNTSDKDIINKAISHFIGGMTKPA